MNIRTGTSAKVSMQQVAKRFLIIFFLLVVIFGGVLAVYGTHLINVKNTEIEIEASYIVDSQLGSVTTDFNSIVSDLLFLSNQKILLESLNVDEAKEREHLSREFLSFATRKDEVVPILRTG